MAAAAFEALFHGDDEFGFDADPGAVVVVGEFRFDASGDDRVVDVLDDLRKASDAVISFATKVHSGRRMVVSLGWCSGRF